MAENVLTENKQSGVPETRNFGKVKKYIFLLISIFILNETNAQTVLRRIAQRHDVYQNNNWQGVDSLVHMYNNNGLRNQTVQWQTSGNIWDYYSRLTWTFNASGQVSTQIRENYQNNNWEPVNRYTYSYDGSGNRIQTLYEIRNGSMWVNNGRNDYTFSTQNAITQIVTYAWANAAWQYVNQAVYTYYPGDSLLKSKTLNVYNTIQNVFYPFYKDEYTYYQNHYMETQTHYKQSADTLMPDYIINNGWNGSVYPTRLDYSYLSNWDTVGLNWLYYSRNTYTYDATNVNVLTDVKELYNIQGPNWVNSSKMDNTYNVNNEQVQSIKQIWDGNAAQWKNDEKTETTYVNGWPDVINLYDFQNNSWVYNLRNTFQYNAADSLTYHLEEQYDGTGFKPNKQDFYYYQNIPVGLADMDHSVEMIKIFPNPVKGNLYLETHFQDKEKYLESSIYDMYGRLLERRVEPAKNERLIYDVSSFKPGIYFIRIVNEAGKTNMAKFIKE